MGENPLPWVDGPSVLGEHERSWSSDDRFVMFCASNSSFLYMALCVDVTFGQTQPPIVLFSSHDMCPHRCLLTRVYEPV